MYLTEIKKLLLSIHQLKGYNEYKSYIESIPSTDQYLSYDYIFVASKSAGSQQAAAIPAAAAHFAAFLSIHLTDDILDNDPAGVHTKYGVGSIANMAQALMAAGFSLLGNYKKENYYPLLVESLSNCIMETCFAQQKEFSMELNEKTYWQLVASKTPPLFSSALYTGTLIATGEKKTATEIAALGKLVGKMIQVSDDLADVFKPFIAPDWYSKMNLPILYALTANHAHKAEFISAIRTINMEGNLERLQAILLQSGAVSYCVYHLIEMNKEMVSVIEQLPVANKEALHELRRSITKPSLEILLSVAGEQYRADISDLIKYS